MNPQNKGFTHILLIIIVVLIALGGIVFYSTKKAQDKFSAKPILESIVNTVTNTTPTPYPANKSTRQLQVYKIVEPNKSEVVFSKTLPVSESSYTSFLVDKDGNLYYNTKNEIFKVEAGSKKETSIYKETIEDGDIGIFRIQLMNNNLYVDTRKDNPAPKSGSGDDRSINTLREMDLFGGQIRVVVEHAGDVFASFKYMGKGNGFDIVEDSTGDGCGGGGGIYKVVSKKTSLITDFAFGCGGGPILAGIDPNKGVILASIIGDHDEINGPQFDTLYIKKFDGGIEPLIDLKPYQGKFSDFILNESATKILLTPRNGTTSFLVNLEDKSVKTINLSQKLQDGSTYLNITHGIVHENTAFLNENGNRTEILHSLNMETGEFNKIATDVKRYTLEPIGFSQNTLFVLGEQSSGY